MSRVLQNIEEVGTMNKYFVFTIFAVCASATISILGICSIVKYVMLGCVWC